LDLRAEPPDHSCITRSARLIIGAGRLLSTAPGFCCRGDLV